MVKQQGEIMDIEKLFGEKKSYIDIIIIGKQNIAMLKSDKVKKRSDVWSKAEGIADQKKDYVKSQVAEIDEKIAKEEANIEYAYNMIDLINDKLVYYG